MRGMRNMKRILLVLAVISIGTALFAVDIELQEVIEYGFELADSQPEVSTDTIFTLGTMVDNYYPQLLSINIRDGEFEKAVPSNRLFGELSGKLLLQILDVENMDYDTYLLNPATGEKTQWDTKWFTPEQRVVEYQNGQFFGG